MYRFTTDDDRFHGRDEPTPAANQETARTGHKPSLRVPGFLEKDSLLAGGRAYFWGTSQSEPTLSGCLEPLRIGVLRCSACRFEGKRRRDPVVRQARLRSVRQQPAPGSRALGGEHQNTRGKGVR
jgi:hypothetical protein